MKKKEMFMRFMCKIGEPFTPLGLLMHWVNHVLWLFVENINKYINGELVLDTEKLAEIEALKEKDKLLQEKEGLEVWLKAHDYIGIQIATGRATVEEYATEIEEMTEKAERINEIDRLLESLWRRKSWK